VAPKRIWKWGARPARSGRASTLYWLWK